MSDGSAIRMGWRGRQNLKEEMVRRVACHLLLNLSILWHSRGAFEMRPTWLDVDVLPRNGWKSFSMLEGPLLCIENLCQS